MLGLLAQLLGQMNQGRERPAGPIPGPFTGLLDLVAARNASGLPPMFYRDPEQAGPAPPVGSGKLAALLKGKQ